MKNGYAHYLLDFIVIVLGISVSYFLNDQKTEHEKSEKELYLFEFGYRI